jgi:Fe-S cluster biosynthesis and repair protein YggX
MPAYSESTVAKIFTKIPGTATGTWIDTATSLLARKELSSVDISNYKFEEL